MNGHPHSIMKQTNKQKKRWLTSLWRYLSVSLHCCRKFLAVADGLCEEKEICFLSIDFVRKSVCACVCVCVCLCVCLCLFPVQNSRSFLNVFPLVSVHIKHMMRITFLISLFLSFHISFSKKKETVEIIIDCDFFLFLCWLVSFAKYLWWWWR